MNRRPLKCGLWRLAFASQSRPLLTVTAGSVQHRPANTTEMYARARPLRLPPYRWMKSIAMWLEKCDSGGSLSLPSAWYGPARSSS